MAPEQVKYFKESSFLDYYLHNLFNHQANQPVVCVILLQHSVKLGPID